MLYMCARHATTTGDATTIGDATTSGHMHVREESGLRDVEHGMLNQCFVIFGKC